MFDNRSAKRRDFLQKVVIDTCDEFNIHNEYICSELGKLIDFFENLLLDTKNIMKNEKCDVYSEICKNASEYLKTVTQSRKDNMRRRMSFAANIEAKSAYNYFEKNILEIISEEEKEDIYTIFSMMSEDFRIEDSTYMHNLSACLLRLRGFLYLVDTHRQTGEEIKLHDIKHDIENLLDFTKKMKTESEINYMNINRLRSKISLILEGY